MQQDQNAAGDDHTHTTGLYAGTLCGCRDHNCPAGAIPDLPCVNEDTRGAPTSSPCEDHDCPTCYEHTIDWSDIAVTGPPSITDRIHRFLRRIIRMQKLHGRNEKKARPCMESRSVPEEIRAIT